MRKVIGGRIYDTERATLVAEAGYGFPGDFSWWHEALYRTPKGSYFLYGKGGAMTRYARSLSDNSMTGGSRITPLSREAALNWCQERGIDAGIIEGEFGDRLEEA